MNLDEFVTILARYQNVFLTGGGGVGKSYLTREIIKYYKATNKGDVIPLGSTGISAVNINGQTVHSFFALGICSDIGELKRKNYLFSSRVNKFKKICKQTTLIIIDEVSMISSNMMEMIAYRLNQARYKGSLLLVGDFYQLPPVLKEREMYDKNGHVFAFESTVWKTLNLKIVNLTEMKRNSDIEFTDIINKIRVGVCDDKVISYLNILCDNDEVKYNDCTYLFPRNYEANEMNLRELDKIVGDEHRIIAKCLHLDKQLSSSEVIAWKNSLITSECLALKVGAPVLFTINKPGICINGDRGVVVKIETDIIYVRKDRKTIALERNDFKYEKRKLIGDEYVENTAYIMSQFPLKLAFAISIHKSQGMSIDNLVCNIDNIFLPHQFYVAISRAKNPKKLKLDTISTSRDEYFKSIIRVDPRVVDYYNRVF